MTEKRSHWAHGLPAGGQRLASPGGLEGLARLALCSSQGGPPIRNRPFPVAVLVATLISIAADDIRLSGTSHATMLSFLGHRSAPVPPARAPTCQARAKRAAADVCGRCAAPPSRPAPSFIANISQFQGVRQGPCPCMRFSLGAPRLPRPQQIRERRLRADLRRPRRRNQRRRPYQPIRHHVRPAGSARRSTSRSRSWSGRPRRTRGARSW